MSLPYVYAFYYGIVAFTGYSFGYGLVVFTFPLILIYLIISGAVAYKDVGKISEAEYLKSLDSIDGYQYHVLDSVHFRPRRRVFRPYRSRSHFSGYRGGFGSGGYGGGGYGGYGGTGSGGYGGGFGGFGGFGG